MLIDRLIIYGNASSKSRVAVHSHLHVNLQFNLKDIEVNPHLYPLHAPCIRALYDHQVELTPTQCRYALEIILGAAYLITHIDTFTSLTEETSRNRKITELTGLVAEPGLFPGNSSDIIKNSIIYRVNEIHEAFQNAMSSNKTLLFFQKAFIGPPCFNGRFITLEAFMMDELQIHPHVKFQHQTEIDKESVELEEILHLYKASNPEMKEKIPPLNSLICYIKSSPSLMEKWKDQMIEPKFSTVYQRACEFYIGVESV